MPMGLYAKHESEILQQPSGCAEDITKTKAFKLLRDDPESRLIINCELFFKKKLLFSINTDEVQFTGYAPKHEYHISCC